MTKERQEYKAGKDNWTPSMDTCYERNCVCTGCSIRELITSQKCYVKVAIRDFIKKHGVPPIIKTKQIIDD